MVPQRVKECFHFVIFFIVSLIMITLYIYNYVVTHNTLRRVQTTRTEHVM
jgi:hypothetical protein